MNDINEILNKVKKINDIELDKDIANVLNIIPSHLSKMKQRNTIPYDKLIEYANKNGISLDYLFGHENIITKDTMQIRYFADVSASCGYGCENDVLEYKEFKIDKSVAKNILNLPTNHSTLDIIKVYGDSMEPFIYNGELAAVDIKKNTLESIKNGDVVIINVDGELYCKKLVKDPFARTLHLISYNKEYPERALSYDEFNSVMIVGVVCQVLNIRTFENGIQKVSHYS